ncbi:MAG: glycosyltransferase family 32 protein [Blautia obeum]
MEKIPHIIHYCWFGRNPKSELVLNCIESWKKYLPGYEIREWNEDNYDVTQVNFVKEAYENQKWAFVSDYVRFDVLISLVEFILIPWELLSLIPEEILAKRAFTGFESTKLISPGLVMGSIRTESDFEILKNIRNLVSCRRQTVL